MYPLTTSQGLVLQTNTLNKITLEETKLVRQPPPYTSMCKDAWGDETLLPFQDLPYHAELCQSFCVDDFLQQFCNCTFLDYIEINRFISPACDFANPEHLICAEKIQNDPQIVNNNIETNCDYCKPQCQELSYAVTLSQATWPSPRYWPVLAEKYNITFNNTGITEDLLLDTVTGTKINELIEDVSPLLARIEGIIREDYLKVQVHTHSHFENVSPPHIQLIADLLQDKDGHQHHRESQVR